jgi:hypothetical protein
MTRDSERSEFVALATFKLKTWTMEASNCSMDHYMVQEIYSTYASSPPEMAAETIPFPIDRVQGFISPVVS